MDLLNCCRTLHASVILLIEADKSCSPDLINLEPEVVVEYGEIVGLNCTSTSEDDLDVFWKTEMEEELSYIEVHATKWDIKAECVIQLNESFQCSNEVNIVVYSKCHYKSWSPFHNIHHCLQRLQTLSGVAVLAKGN